MTDAARPRLAIVGRGRAAAALVPRWQAAGYPIVDQRTRADGPIALLAAADVVIVAVSDGAIEEVARALAARPSAADELWLHLSGSRAAAILRVMGADGVSRPRGVGGLHPLVALSGPDAALDGAVAGVEGDADAVVVAEALARAAGLAPVRLDPAGKAAYHAAAVTVAGHATALFAQALTLMAAAGIGADDARRALQPLLRSAAENLAGGPPERVSTGPIVRGDVGTIAAHLAAADALAAPHVAATYRLLARTQLALVAERLAPATRAALVKLLDDQG